MESNTCMNAQCGTATSSEWRKGWALRSGQFVSLCDKCGSVYDQTIFCEVFHAKESGWRECIACGKRLHCGCIASRFLVELLDTGGVNCVTCARKSGLVPMVIDEKPSGYGLLKIENINEMQSTVVESQLGGCDVQKMNLMKLNNNSESVAFKHLFQFQSDDSNRSFEKMKRENVLPLAGEIGNTCFSNFMQISHGPQASKADVSKANIGPIDIYESLAQTNLSITLGTPSGNPCPSNVGAIIDEKGKSSSMVQQAPRSRQLLPKPPRSSLATGLESNSSIVSQIRVARPPAEGRGRNQLLPRYWPRITDQELQQISGDSNSTIVPLFEKVLSASDAGRIGRLVLPKACAEAYFPPISQPEGLPLRIQDVKGKEWVFQFRFWPNNNSRMYVLEGVTPCIQAMQLQAGDTVTFSRMDPEGKLVMGFRKATNSTTIQESQSAIASVAHSSDSYFSGVFGNLPVINGYSGLLQSLKGSTDIHQNTLSKNLNSVSGNVSWHIPEKNEDMTRDSLLLPSMLAPERKRTRNIGSKSKRLLIDSLDALELKLTWEEAQDLLRPSPSAKPSIVTIEEHDFEEYEVPPVFGKRSIFVARSTGVQEQWAQCDSCFKWRRLPMDFLLPAKWTCAENNWDPSRSSCSLSDELNPREQESLLKLSKDFKRRRMITSNKPTFENESSGLDALANASICGDKTGDPGTTSVAATTKHPRHRPGCSCIVCIQPPSGKGKHKPTCTCNVCMTVKRRFKTLMMRKKKRQSEREAEIAQRNQKAWGPKEEAEVDSVSKHVSSNMDTPENETKSVNELESNTLAETGTGQIDLNCHPDREEDTRARVSMMSLLQVANSPLETYLKQNGLTTLISEQPESSTSQVHPQATGESEGHVNEEVNCMVSPIEEQEKDIEENLGPDTRPRPGPGPNQNQNDAP